MLRLPILTSQTGSVTETDLNKKYQLKHDN